MEEILSGRSEALDHLWLRLSRMQAMLQTTICDGLAFDPFAFEEDGLGASKIDVSWGVLLQTSLLTEFRYN